MPTALAWGVLELALGMGLALSGEGSLQAEVRAQRMVPLTGPATSGLALDVRPGLAVVGEDPTLRLELRYGPLLSLRRDDSAEVADWLHVVTGRAWWRPEAALTLEGEGIFTRGTADFRLLGVAGGWVGSGEAQGSGPATPVLATLTFEALRARVWLEDRFSARWRLSATLAASREEGLGEARSVLPLQEVIRSRGELEWRAGSRTALAGVVVAEASRTGVLPPSAASPPGADQQGRFGQLSLLLRHEPWPDTSTWVGIGLAVAGNSPALESPGAQPAGELGIEHRLHIQGEGDEPQAPTRNRVGVLGRRTWGVGPPGAQFGAAMVVAPVADRFSGLVASRADLQAWGSWTSAAQWKIGAKVSSGLVLQGSGQRDQVAGGELRADWSFSAVLLAAGARGSVQRVPGISPDLGSEWSVFLGLEAVYPHH